MKQIRKVEAGFHYMLFPPELISVKEHCRHQFLLWLRKKVSLFELFMCDESTRTKMNPVMDCFYMPHIKNMFREWGDVCCGYDVVKTAMIPTLIVPA